MNKPYTHLNSLKLLYSHSLKLVLINTFLCVFYGMIIINAHESKFES